MKKSLMGQLRRWFFKVAARPVRALIKLILRDEPTTAWLMHTMGNSVAMSRHDITHTMPADLTEIRGFEDCAWLFSSNPLNHGASRLRLDEAAFLYRKINKMRQPRVLEIGRYKGGTTIMLASAGATVSAIDSGKIPGQKHFKLGLIAALEQVGLRCNVEIVDTDGLSYARLGASFDLVFLDVGVDSFELTEDLFECWWPRLSDGGIFLFRDGKDTVLKEASRFVKTLSYTDFDGVVDFNLPGAFVLCVKNS